MIDVVAVIVIRCTGCGVHWRLADNRRPRAGGICPTCVQTRVGVLVPPSRRVQVDLVGERLDEDVVRLFDGRTMCT